MEETMERIIIFDGVCHLCNHSVQFILKRDSKELFTLASSQGVNGQKLLNSYGFSPELTNSFVLIENKKIYIKSSAALRICLQLKGLWKILSILRIIPRPIRDLLYDLVAKNRYNWFGKTESCMLPSPEWKKRFLD